VFLLLAVVVSALVWLPIQRMLAVAGVQNCLDRDWEISFGPEELVRPKAMPASVDDSAQSVFQEIAERLGRGGWVKENRDTIWHERFRALFRGRIEEIHIYYPGEFRGDLGIALQRFPHLRRLGIWATSGLTEAQWKRFFKGLRELPELEEVEFGGQQVTDAALAPLSGHSRLRVLSVLESALTSKCARTLSELPNLKEVRFDSASSFPAAEEGALRAALPRLQLDLPEKEPEPEKFELPALEP